MTNPRYQVIPRTMCFVFHRDHILLIQANTSKDWAGTWDPVGGHIEKGESLIASANREIREETGIAARNTRIAGVVHADDFFGKDIMMFVTASDAHDMQTSEDGREGTLHWTQIADLEKVNVFPDVKPILERVMTGKFFSARSTFEDGKLVELIFD